MIKSIEIKNFKSLKEKKFNLRNLNLLFGLNGMGKSTFIQSLLLFRQSADRLKYGELKLNGDHISIGNTKDALYQYSKSENLSFSFEFAEFSSNKLEYEYEIDSDIFKLKDEHIDKEVLSTNFLKQSLFSNNFQYLNAVRINPTSIQSKNYSNVVVSKNVGEHGEFTAHFIDVHGNNDIQFDNLLHEKSKTIDSVTNTEFINKSLGHQINLWMSEISPGITIRTTSIPSTENILLEYVFKQPNYGTTNSFKPINVGFGISYVLPVVTSLLASKPGELLIIENPESHIHPRGQAELGKLIALASANDVQIIVETHSDHVLNGIRVAIKEKKAAKKDILLLHFDKVVSEKEQYSKITDIDIDDNGELSDYPTNLIEEWSNQLLKLI